VILRKVAASLIRRDWGMVLIEILVVVVGIFIGLQVDDWNLARKQCADRQIYLDRLGADVDLMIDRETLVQQRFESRRDQIHASRSALQTCRLTEGEKDSFESALLGHQVMPRPQLERATFDEMVAGGALARIDDPALKQSISTLFAEGVDINDSLDYFSADLGRASDIVWHRVTLLVDAAPAQADDSTAYRPDEQYPDRVDYHSDALCQDTIFRHALIEVLDSIADRLHTSREFTAKLLHLKGLLRSRV